MNECESNQDNCDVKADCANTEGGFECTCRPGYEGPGSSCSDINECETGDANCDSNADCVNKKGSYSCHCKDGYSGDGTQCTGRLEIITITIINFIYILRYIRK